MTLALVRLRGGWRQLVTIQPLAQGLLGILVRALRLCRVKGRPALRLAADQCPRRRGHDMSELVGEQRRTPLRCGLAPSGPDGDVLAHGEPDGVELSSRRFAETVGVQPNLAQVDAEPSFQRLAHRRSERYSAI